MPEYRITNQHELRAEFWETHPDLVCTENRRGSPLPQNDQPTDTRCAWVDWIDMLSKNGDISPGLAERATL